MKGGLALGSQRRLSRHSIAFNDAYLPTIVLDLLMDRYATNIGVNAR
jgi:hypothetical protein